jgi:agmatinase
MHADFEAIFSEHSLSWPTFLNTKPSDSRPGDSLVWVIPVKYDSTVSFYGGTKYGAKAIIDASAELEDFDVELQKDSSLVGISTLPYLEPDVSSPRRMIQIVEDVVSKAFQMHKIPFVLGGEHTLSIGSVAAASKYFENLSVLYLDAHGDLRNTYLGSKYCHATVTRRLMDSANVVHVGARTLSISESNFISNSETNGLNHFPGPEGGQYSSETIHAICDSLNENVYISLDLDVLDPSVMPSVGAPEPGGLSWEGINHIIRMVAETRKVCGVDVVELSPSLGPPFAAFTAAKLVYRLIGYCT